VARPSKTEGFSGELPASTLIVVKTAFHPEFWSRAGNRWQCEEAGNGVSVGFTGVRETWQPNVRKHREGRVPMNGIRLNPKARQKKMLTPEPGRALGENDVVDSGRDRR